MPLPVLLKSAKKALPVFVWFAAQIDHTEGLSGAVMIVFLKMTLLFDEEKVRERKKRKGIGSRTLRSLFVVERFELLANSLMI